MVDHEIVGRIRLSRLLLKIYKLSATIEAGIREDYLKDYTNNYAAVRKNGRHIPHMKSRKVVFFCLSLGSIKLAHMSVV